MTTLTYLAETIAESYGGGGHKGAAGFVSDKLLFAPADKTDD